MCGYSLGMAGRLGGRIGSWALVFVLIASGASGRPALAEAPDEAAAEEPLVLVIMDPLAAPLSCPCVQGYAQRDYEKLAEHLEEWLGREVHVAFSESLARAMKDQTAGKADIVIGKQSVVEFDAKNAEKQFQRVAMLTGKDGETTQTGLIVVRSGDAATSVADLNGYRIIFGPRESAEKHQAALKLLEEQGVSLAGDPETRSACDEGATLILELGPDEHGAAVISSYAKPLLEGCGTVKKGDLRVVGETAPVPFIAAFVASHLDSPLRTEITEALLAVAEEPILCRALESKAGFVGGDEEPSADALAAKKN